MRFNGILLMTIILLGRIDAAAAQYTIQGSVSFTGQAPERKLLVRDSDPVCAAVEGFAEDIVVTDGKLRDVLVRIVNPPKGDANVSNAAVIRQNKCAYEPHVVGVMEGQSLSIENADPTFHNVRGNAGTKTLWNTAQPSTAPPIVRDAGSLGKAGDVVVLHCDVHPWMQAYIYVQASPFFAVSAADGSFSIGGLPPGKYTLEAIHPVLGKKTAKVTISRSKKSIATGKSATVSIRYVSK
jgi:plastocyanin